MHIVQVATNCQKEKSKNTIKIRIIQNKVCTPHADAEYIITSYNTYHRTDMKKIGMYLFINCTEVYLSKQSIL